MEQSPSWEAHRLSASQEISLIFWSQEVYWCIQNSPTPVPILSFINPPHALHSPSWKIHFNIIKLLIFSSLQIFNDLIDETQFQYTGSSMRPHCKLSLG